MALAERAELVARLSLKDDFSGRLRGVEGSLRSSVGRMGGIAAKGVRNAATNITRIGAVAAVGVTAALKSGIDNLVELEDATTSVTGAIEQMGLTGQVTAGQIADWANEIEASVQAAFDDKAITQSATTVIRYGKVSTDNLKPALVVMTDLAAKTGDLDSAASLLAKALADPAKAAAKLQRQGIILTKAEQDQIAAMVKANDAAGAQRVLLEALTRTTKGAAAASAGPYKDAQNTLRDTWEDITRTLATGAMPVLMEIQQLLTEELLKPGTMQKVKEFGQGIAGGLRGLVDIARNIPWAQVGDAFTLMGKGAKAALDLFTSMPPWVQTAVLTGWGLNKLTGGALGSIVGELGKGLIKGVLGMNAGVVNINAATVNGVPGGGAPTGGGGGLMGKLLLGTAIGAVVAEGFGVMKGSWEHHDQVVAANTKAIETVGKYSGRVQKVAPQRMSPDERQEHNDSQRALDRVRASTEASHIAIVSATRTGDNAIIRALYATRPMVAVKVSVTGNTVRTTYDTGTTLGRNVNPNVLKYGLT